MNGTITWWECEKLRLQRLMNSIVGQHWPDYSRNLPREKLYHCSSAVCCRVLRDTAPGL
jgi:hypothetical protein